MTSWQVCPQKATEPGVFNCAKAADCAQGYKDQPANRNCHKPPAVARVVQVYSRISCYLIRGKPPPTAPLSQHAYGNKHQSQDQKGWEYHISQYPQVRIAVAARCKLDNDKEQYARQARQAEDHAGKAYVVAQ